MGETTSRPDVVLRVTWKPNTGALDIKFDNANAMEAIGILHFASHALIAQQCKSSIVPAGPFLPHLVKQ